MARFHVFGFLTITLCLMACLWAITNEVAQVNAADTTTTTTADYDAGTTTPTKADNDAGTTTTTKADKDAETTTTKKSGDDGGATTTEKPTKQIETTTPSDGKKGTTQGPGSDTSMIVSVPLLFALIACASLH